MLHVLLDTSIYRQDELRRSAGFITLTSLCRQGLIRLHVPTIVKREFSSAVAMKAEAAAQEAVKAVRDLSRREGPAQAGEAVREVLARLEPLPGEYSRHAVEAFDTWLQHVGAEMHDVRPECLEDVLDRYFNGRPPFSSAKRREDFPDSFIWHVVRDVATGKGRLYVIVHDKKFRAALDGIESVETFETLDQFIQSDPVQELFPDNFLRARAADIIDILRFDDWQLRDAVEEAVRSEVEGQRIFVAVRDSEDDADIVNVEEIVDVIFDFQRAGFYGGNVLRVPFRAELKAVLDYFILKSTLFGMPDSELEMFDVQDPDWNEYYAWVREGRHMTVEGKLSVTVDIQQLIRDTAGGGGVDHVAVTNSSTVTLDSIDEVKLTDRRYYI